MDARELTELLQTKGLDFISKVKSFDSFTDKNGWENHRIWQSWTTQLDNSCVGYVSPEIYDLLCVMTGMHFEYIPVASVNLTLYLLGTISVLRSPLHVIAQSSNLSDELLPMYKFADLLFNDYSKRASSWDISYSESIVYFKLHRKIVRILGDLLEIDMRDHDLTKTRIVLCSLGYLHHWPTDKTQVIDTELTEAAWAVVHTQHLIKENHHRQYKGDIDTHKLLVDIISVHVQKDAVDKEHGWDVNEKYIPSFALDDWLALKAKHSHLNLYRIIRERMWEHKFR